MIIASIIVGIIMALIFGPIGFGIGTVGTMIIIAVCKICSDIAATKAKEEQEKELNKRGLQTIQVTCKVRHRYKGTLSPYDNEETRTQEIIVPMDKNK